MINKLRELLIDLRLYYIYLDSKFYRLGNNTTQFEFYKSFLTQPSLIFDVGANIGQRTKIFKDLGANVVCFEPQPNCIRHLKSRFIPSNKIKLAPIGLGEEVGSLTMYVSNIDVISTMSVKHRDEFAKRIFKDSQWTSEIVVDIETLDDQITKFGMPDFIKIDVEGFEFEVIKGLTIPVPKISFEFTPMPNLIDDTIACINHLTKMSDKYRFNFSLGENLSFKLPAFVTASELTSNDSFLKANSFGDVYAFLDES